MYHRYQGDRIGEEDEYGIAEWYPKCKVRKEGDVYIATPHTTNPSRRGRYEPESVAVCIEDGKYKPAVMNSTPAEDDKPQEGNNPQNAQSRPWSVISITHRQLFDELYEKYFKLKPHERKQAILSDMLALFQSEEDARNFVDLNWLRKKRNVYSRKKRFEYKARNQQYEYFFTITYDDKKHTEESFKAGLKSVFANLHKRYGCLFQGVWERGEENDRLHFHGLIYDPNHKITEGLTQVRDYNPKTGRMKTYLQSEYFAERFGRNEFSEIIPQLYDVAIAYITKYLSKQGVKPYYSKGLYSFIESDICGDDVLCKMDDGSGRDIRLIVAKDFGVWDNGEHLGKASPETIALAPKIP